MASTEEYLAYFMSQMDDAASVRTRKMMGEYLIYVDDVLVGGIYDDRLLLKETSAGRKLMPEAETALPYDGAKHEMLIVDCIDNPHILASVMKATAEALSTATQ